MQQPLHAAVVRERHAPGVASEKGEGAPPAAAAEAQKLCLVTQAAHHPVGGLQAARLQCWSRKQQGNGSGAGCAAPDGHPFMACRQLDCHVSHAGDRAGGGMGKLRRVNDGGLQAARVFRDMHWPCWGCQGLCLVGQAAPPAIRWQTERGLIKQTAGAVSI